MRVSMSVEAVAVMGGKRERMPPPAGGGRSGS
jgi:hypothetical protein